MSQQPNRGINEYYIYTGTLDTTASAGTIAHIPIPAGGHVVRAYATEFVANTVADTDITFEVAGVALKKNGATATLTIASGGAAIGKSHVIEFDEVNSDNVALEAEDGDLLAAGSVLEIITDAVGTAGSAGFTIAIRRG